MVKHRGVTGWLELTSDLCHLTSGLCHLTSLTPQSPPANENANASFIGLLWGIHEIIDVNSLL